MDNICIGMRIATSRILMHSIGGIQLFCATVNTNLVTLPVLFRTAVPAVLVALVVGHFIDVFFSSVAYHLGNLITLIELGTHCKYRKIACRSLRAWLFGWHWCCSLLFFLFRRSCICLIGSRCRKINRGPASRRTRGSWHRPFFWWA